MHSETDARDYLSELTRRTIERRGAIQLMRREDLDDPDLDALGKSVNSEIVRTENRTWAAPTAWHAAVWLRNVAHQAASEPITLDRTSIYSNGSLLFRGQRDSRWKLTSSLERLNRQQQVEHMAACLLFSRIMHTHWIPREVPTTFDEMAHIGVAQHYGVIKTPFLDFTTDPYTAMFFAGDGADDQHEVAVFLLPLYPAEDSGLLIYLAPPWVQRISAQRGVFIDTRGIPSEQVESFCFKLTYPANSRWAATDHSPSKEKIYPEGKWIVKASEWVLGIAQTGTGSDWREAIGEPPFKDDVFYPNRLIGDGWYEYLLDVIQALALRGSPDEETLQMDGRALAVLANQNSGIFLALRLVTEMMQKADLLGESLDHQILATLAEYERSLNAGN